MHDEYSYEDNDEEIQLSYDLLKRYLNIGCNISEAIVLTGRTLDGECVMIKTSRDKDTEPDSYDTNFLFDFLFDDEDLFS